MNDRQVFATLSRNNADVCRRSATQPLQAANLVDKEEHSVFKVMDVLARLGVVQEHELLAGLDSDAQGVHVETTSTGIVVHYHSMSLADQIRILMELEGLHFDPAVIEVISDFNSQQHLSDAE